MIGVNDDVAGGRLAPKHVGYTRIDGALFYAAVRPCSRANARKARQKGLRLACRGAATGARACCDACRAHQREGAQHRVAGRHAQC